MKTLRRILPLAFLAIAALSLGACASCHTHKAKTSCCASGSCSK